MKVKSAVLHEVGLPRSYADSAPLRIEEVELEAPGDGEILVRIAAAGLCHSDLSVIDGARPRPLPMAIGHEAAGVVEETGPGVTDLRPGDHVVMVFVPSCGHCLPCMEGRPALCEPGAVANAAGTLLGGGRRLQLGGKTVNHHMGVSAFSEYATMSRRSVVKVDSSLPLDEAALFGCAVLTGVGAVVNTAGVEPGATVAVVGLGGVGLNAVLGALLSGSRRVVAIDLQDDKLGLARQLGATDTFNAGDADCVEQVREATGGGVDYAFEMAGAVAAMDLCNFEVQHVNLVAEERTVKGSYVGSCVPLRDVPRFIELYQQGRLPVDRLMSDRVRFDGLNAAFDALADGHTVRQVLIP
jgi:alcohol dehydrogenase